MFARIIAVLFFAVLISGCAYDATRDGTDTHDPMQWHRHIDGSLP